MNKEQGKIVHYHPDKGFGFIQYRGNQEIFFHERQFRAGRTPIIGEMVVFEIKKDKSGRDCADNVQELAFVQKQQAKRQKYEAYQARQEQKQGGLNFWCAFALMYIIIFMGVMVFASLSFWLLGIYVIMGAVSFVLYYKDKLSAQSGGWRTPESTLHLVDALGGWVGATFAHKLLNHKATKPKFRALFYVTVFVNILMMMALLFYVAIMH